MDLKDGQPLPEPVAQVVGRIEELTAQVGEGGRSEPDRRLVLVVEDDPDIRSLTAALFEAARLEVLETATAEAAVAVMERRGGDVAMLFVDVRLVGLMDGVDLARSVATLWPRTTVVVTSGDPGDRLASLPENVTFMPKPWRALDVLSHAERAMHHPRSMVD